MYATGKCLARGGLSANKWQGLWRPVAAWGDVSLPWQPLGQPGGVSEDEGI